MATNGFNSYIFSLIEPASHNTLRSARGGARNVFPPLSWADLRTGGRILAGAFRRAFFRRGRSCPNLRATLQTDLAERYPISRGVRLLGNIPGGGARALPCNQPTDSHFLSSGSRNP